jgi:L-lactate dehydrogenase complex protein LldG
MSREEVLARIRRSLAPARAADIQRRAKAEERLVPVRHRIPARGKGTAAELRHRFIEEAARNKIEVVALPHAEMIPQVVAAHLSRLGVPLRVRIGADAMLASLAWSKVPVLETATGPAQPDDTAAVSHAVAGVAESGTLVLASGAANPTSLALLPETHIVALSGSSIVGCYEDALDALRAGLGPRNMPRSLNLISGPSCTGDIGGRIVLGAHGPRRLAVMLIDAPSVQ